MSTSSDGLKLSNTLSIHCFTLTLVDKLIKVIQQIPEYNSKRLDNELTKSVMKFVRDEIIKATGTVLSYEQAQSLDVKQIIIMALCKCFNLDDNESIIISNQIEFLLDNKLIKRKTFKKAIKYINSFFSSK